MIRRTSILSFTGNVPPSLSGSWIKERDGGLVQILLANTGRFERKLLWGLLYSS